MGKALLQEIAGWKLESKLEDNTRYFFHTDVVGQIESGAYSYIIGRKGTGKTAISEHLHRQKDPKKFCQKLTFKSFPFQNLYELPDSKFNPPNQYITLWKYVIYTTVAKLFIGNENINPAVREMLAKIYSHDSPQSLAQNISQWTSVNFEFKVLGTGLGAGIVRQELRDKATWHDRVEVLQQLLLQHIDDSSYLIVFDELDEDYRAVADEAATRQYAELLTGLFKAVQDIRSIFSDPTKRLLPVVFLRDDIYNTIQDPDKTKWADLSFELDWNEVAIKSLLEFRLSRANEPTGAAKPFNEAWHLAVEHGKVFFGHNGRNSKHGFDYITRSTLLRPRDYIRFLSLSAKEALLDNRNLISPKILLKVDKAFSNYLRSELEDEIQGALPQIKKILDLISHNRKPYFPISDFISAYNSAVARKELDAWNPEAVAKILFHFSVIGNMGRDGRGFVFRYQNREARLNLSESICVHRGLFKAFQII